MDISFYKTEEGKSLYEEYPGDFDAGCLINVGSCVANGHISGAAIKVASIFAKRTLKGNFEEIASRGEFFTSLETFSRFWTRASCGLRCSE